MSGYYSGNDECEEESACGGRNVVQMRKKTGKNGFANDKSGAAFPSNSNLRFWGRNRMANSDLESEIGQIPSWDADVPTHFQTVDLNRQHQFRVSPTLQHAPQKTEAIPAESTAAFADLFTLIDDGDFDGIGSHHCDGKMHDTRNFPQFFPSQLNMNTVNFLGISIVGQSCPRGDSGIYVVGEQLIVRTFDICWPISGKCYARW